MKSEAVPKYRWKISFELKNAQIKDSEEIVSENINLKQIGGRKEKLVKGKLFFETDYDDSRIISDVDKKLDEFLNMTALYYFRIGINPSFILEKYDYTLENYDELLSKGVKPKVKGKFETNSYIELTQQYLDDVPQRLKTLNSSKHKHYIDNILRQYRIAYMQDEPFIRYEQLWITFMTLLNSLESNPDWDDKKLIRAFAKRTSSTLEKKHVEDILSILSKSAWQYDILILGQHMKDEKCGNFIHFLIKLKIPQWQKTTTYSDELEEIIKAKKEGKQANVYEELMKILFCLYGIRNQLFHCTPYSIKELNVGRMRLACFALATIVRVSINSYIVKYTDLE